MLCSSCGSKGLHTSCGKLDPKRNEWNCENCSQVAGIPVEGNSQSQRNLSNMGLKQPYAPWSETALLKRTRNGSTGSIEEDDDVTAPKKNKVAPVKKTPKVVQLQSRRGDPNKSPISPAPGTSLISAKKTPTKTPNVNSPSNFGTPKSIISF